ncbi:MAG: hypothetical protein KF684_08530 [Phycisphaeraceae bacterium]|nr:hypothetical protein [Phycisphaeraceae bacterium]
MTNNQPPADTVMLGPIRAAIWENQTEKGGRYYSVTFERRYFDSESGSWKSTTSYGRDDLLPLSKVAEMACLRIHELQSLSRAKQRDGAGGAGAGGGAESEPQPETQSTPPANSAGGNDAPQKAARARAKAGVSR